MKAELLLAFLLDTCNDHNIYHRKKHNIIEHRPVRATFLFQPTDFSFRSIAAHMP